MSEDAPIGGLENEALIEASAAAEAKRRAARRRFLGRSAATGSGLVIVTLFHSRAFADTKNVSSVEACNSLHGTLRPGTVESSVPGGPARMQCDFGINGYGARGTNRRRP